MSTSTLGPSPPVPPFKGWGAHAGLGRRLPGGTPSAASILSALRIGVAYIEIDVQVTLDGHLIARHDDLVEVPRPQAGRPRHLPHRRSDHVPIQSLTLAQVRGIVPHTLTLDEVVGLVGDRVPILLDVHTDGTAEPLGHWLARNGDRGRFRVCSKSIAGLATLRSIAPDTPRWLTLSGETVSARHRHPAWALLRGFLQQGDAGDMAQTLGAVLHAIASEHPRWRFGPFQGITWRPYLRAGLQQLTESVGASGLCVHQWLVTRELVNAAQDLGLQVTAWTVNHEADARRLIGLGVDQVTSDDPALLRQAVSRPGVLRRLGLKSSSRAFPARSSRRIWATPVGPPSGADIWTRVISKSVPSLGRNASPMSRQPRSPTM